MTKWEETQPLTSSVYTYNKLCKLACEHLNPSSAVELIIRMAWVKPWFEDKLLSEWSDLREWILYMDVTIYCVVSGA